MKKNLDSPIIGKCHVIIRSTDTMPRMEQLLKLYPRKLLYILTKLLRLQACTLLL